MHHEGLTFDLHTAVWLRPLRRYVGLQLWPCQWPCWPYAHHTARRRARLSPTPTIPSRPQSLWSACAANNKAPPPSAVPSDLSRLRRNAAEEKGVSHDHLIHSHLDTPRSPCPSGVATLALPHSTGAAGTQEEEAGEASSQETTRQEEGPTIRTHPSIWVLVCVVRVTFAGCGGAVRMGGCVSVCH